MKKRTVLVTLECETANTVKQIARYFKGQEFSYFGKDNLFLKVRQAHIQVAQGVKHK